MIIDFFIPAASAADTAAGLGRFFSPDILIIIAFGLVFYFIIWRPQSKRAKEHKALVSGLGKGDEVVTNGGLLGKVVRVDDQFILLEVAAKVELRVQKHAVSAALPKGTIKGI